jgi:hypothetical protein
VDVLEELVTENEQAAGIATNADNFITGILGLEYPVPFTI